MHPILQLILSSLAGFGTAGLAQKGLTNLAQREFIKKLLQGRLSSALTSGAARTGAGFGGFLAGDVATRALFGDGEQSDEDIIETETRANTGEIKPDLNQVLLDDLLRQQGGGLF